MSSHATTVAPRHPGFAGGQRIRTVRYRWSDAGSHDVVHLAHWHWTNGNGSDSHGVGL